MSEPVASCPICRRSLDEPQSIYVCNACHGSLATDGMVPVHVTGEFPAVSQMAMMPDDAAEAVPERTRRPTNPAEHDCTWCGKAGDQVKKLLTRGQAKICNECVSLCADIMQSELGDDWR